MSRISLKLAAALTAASLAWVPVTVAQTSPASGDMQRLPATLQLSAPGSQHNSTLTLRSSLPPGAGSQQPAPESVQAPVVRSRLPPPPTTPEPPSSGVLTGEVASIDLPSVLSLAGVQNPELLIARQRVVEAVAVRQLAAAQILPNLNLGMNYDDHTGALQQSSGRIIQLHRQSLYVGGGANAIAAGTVNIPGVQYNVNISNAIYGALTSRQAVRTQQLTAAAVRNQVLMDVSVGYVELLRAECRRALALQIRADAAEVARLTANYARTGEGRKADADRAATELAGRETDLLEFEGEVLTNSARLAQMLNLDPAIRLHPADGWVVPAPLVPAPIPLSELIGTAMLQRPELAAQRSAIRESFLQLRAQQVLPFSPQVMAGLSAGGFGGGSNRQDLGAQSLFGSFDSRVDVDVVTYWTLQNMGLGNRAMIAAARARLSQSNFRQLEVLNQVRFEVASAYAQTHARFAQIGTAEQAVRFATDAFREDLIRIRGREGLPIEVLDSLRLLARSRMEYLDAISDYNRAEFELYVALGQPPADTLARPVPEGLVPQPAGSLAEPNISKY
jgi:outer membrane protein TolC